MADARSASFVLAKLDRTKVSGTDFFNAFFNGATIGDLDLSVAVNLDSALHYGPSLVAIDAFLASKCSIPEAFLRGCGIPDGANAAFANLKSVPRAHFSCFVSFSEPDDAFAERLRCDLVSAGIRCWRWKEDARWGRTLIREIDEAIRDHDKVLVICSSESLKSEPVIREIDRALQREQQLGKEVLFPLRLDDAVFCWSHELQPDVLRKYVANFCSWRDPQAYHNSFVRLVRDLRAGDS